MRGNGRGKDYDKKEKGSRQGLLFKERRKRPSTIWMDQSRIANNWLKKEREKKGGLLSGYQKKGKECYAFYHHDGGKTNCGVREGFAWPREKTTFPTGREGGGERGGSRVVG